MILPIYRVSIDEWLYSYYNTWFLIKLIGDVHVAIYSPDASLITRLQGVHYGIDFNTRGMTVVECIKRYHLNDNHFLFLNAIR